MSEFCLEEFKLKWRLVLKEEKGREMVLFSTIDIAAVTSPANQQFI